MKDFNAGDVVDLKFTSISSGVPSALTGGVVNVYRDNNVTQSAAGVTLTSTFDSIVGFNHLRVETTADGTFYAAGQKFQAMLSAGTVGGSTVAGYVVGEFTIRYGTVDDIAAGTTMLSTDADDLIAESTLISAESTATAAVVDLISAESTASAANIDNLVTEATLHTTQLQDLTSASSRIEAETTAISSDLEQLTSSSSRLEVSTTGLMAGTTALAAEATAHTTQLQLLTSATTTLSTDIDDLISSTTLIHAESTASAANIDNLVSATTTLSTDIDDLITSTTNIEANLPDVLSLANINSQVDTALVDAGVVHQVTTISSLTSQTAFELAAGSTSDSAYVGDMAIITDSAIGTEKAVGLISAYSGAMKAVTLKADPAIFTMSTNDLITIVPVSRALPAGLADGAAGLPVSDAGGLDLDGLTSETSGIAAGTTMLEVDADNLIAETTLIRAESTATAAVVDLIAAETSALTTSLEQLTSSSSRLEAEATAHTTTLEQLTSASSRLEAEATSHTTQLQLLTSATTTLSTDIDDLITTTTAIQAGVVSSGVAMSTAGADVIWTVLTAELSTAMPATPNVLDVLAFQHMAAWNKRVTTGTSGFDIIYTDAGSTIFLAAITEPTTASFQRAQWTT